ncbi:MAG: lacto-N-biose phosphorylase central domain-containing protein, partial [Lacrimispora sphenoides]
EHSHFITEDSSEAIDFGEGMKNIYALSDAEILKKEGEDVQMAVNQFGDGRSVYISGIPYSFENSRMLYRAIFWAAGMEQEMKKWYSSNYHVEVNYYPATGKYCIVNNTYEPQETVIYDGNGQACSMQLKANDILWFSF